MVVIQLFLCVMFSRKTWKSQNPWWFIHRLSEFTSCSVSRWWFLEKYVGKDEATGIMEETTGIMEIFPQTTGIMEEWDVSKISVL